MANRWLISTGNCNNSAIYNGGTLPSSSDVLWLNGYNLIINDNFEVAEVRNQIDSGIGVVAGGGISWDSLAHNKTTKFDAYLNGGIGSSVCSASNAVITHIGNLTKMSSGSDCLRFQNASNVIFNFYGDIINGVAGDKGFVIQTFGSATTGVTLNIYGDCKGNNAVYWFIETNKCNIYGAVDGTGSTAQVIWGSTTIDNLITVGTVIMPPTNAFVLLGRIRFRVGEAAVIVPDENGSPLPLTDPTQQDQALESDVRDGVMYNNGTLEGVMDIPDEVNVTKNIKFDNNTKTGKALLTEQAIANAVAQVVGAQFNGFEG